MSKNIHSIRPQETCFVISPIGEPNSEARQRSDKVFRHIISPAAEANGLVAVRSDQDTTPGMITSQIIRHILNDKMVVADLSDRNANVFYELALRHAFRKPIVQLILSTQTIPFDVHGSRTVQYELDLDSVSEALKDVSAQIKTSLSQGFEVESPVTSAARLEELARSTTPESQLLSKTIADQIDGLNKTVSDLSKLICRPEDMKEVVKDQVGLVVQGYSSKWDAFQRTQAQMADVVMSLPSGRLKRRREIIPLEELAGGAKGILLIARTASRVSGLSLFEGYLRRGGKLRFVVTNPEAFDRNDIEAVTPMPLTGEEARAVFSAELKATLRNIQNLRKLSDQVEVGLTNYISNLSFVMVDEGDGRGRVMVELMPYKCPELDRPHIELTSHDLATYWYDLFRDTCEAIWNHVTPIAELSSRQDGDNH